MTSKQTELSVLWYYGSMHLILMYANCMVTSMVHKPVCCRGVKQDLLDQQMAVDASHTQMLSIPTEQLQASAPNSSAISVDIPDVSGPIIDSSATTATAAGASSTVAGDTPQGELTGLFSSYRASHGFPSVAASFTIDCHRIATPKVTIIARQMSMHMAKYCSHHGMLARC